MSSDGAPPEGTKKRRLRGACDICRRQKIRCDSAKMPNNRCSNCVSFNSECTHDLSQHKQEKGPRRKRTTTQQDNTSPAESSPVPDATAANDSTLQIAKNVVDGLLRETPTYQAPQDREALLQLLLEVSRYARSLEQELTGYRSHTSPSDRGTTNSVSPQTAEQDAEPEGESGIVLNYQKLPERIKRITTQTSNNRFFGKNSSLMFVTEAIAAHQEDITNIAVARSTRPLYWTRQPWEVFPETPVVHVFPPDDLLRDLVDIYFTQLNIYTLILHRPTFEKSLADGFHLRDHLFGATVLAVCAMASKNSLDKRVLVPGTQTELCAGWEWLRQIRRPFGGPVVQSTSLCELQLCCLYINYQQSGSDLESCWLLCGTGILYAQDIGAHRRPKQDGPLSVEAELLKRCFHYLCIYDAIASACFGRPRVCKASECDLDLPVAFDDEYRESSHPEKTLKQLRGKSSLSDFYVVYINLMNIFTFSWKTAGSPQTYMTPMEAETIAELDSRLNKWVQEIPEHLLWNPYMEDDVFFDQSAALYASYYHVQLLAHRPFIRLTAKQSFKSLSICTNAARSCSHVVDVKSRRGFFPSPQLVKAAFDSAIVLMLNVSGGTRSGLSIDTERELVDVYKCMSFLRQSERRWQPAGRFYDTLCELMNASNLPLPPVPLAEDHLDHWLRKPTSGISGLEPDPESWPDHLLSLPMAVEDLGRLPIYGSLDFSEMDVLDKFVPEATAAADSLPLNQLSLPFSNIYTGSNLPGSCDPESEVMDMDGYLSHWIPYSSHFDEMMVQMTQSGSLGN
ncbi:fungal-specific transcription factor domain-containing protein [Mycena epipterygia]|nr:fungal-specific transcription factor domain-containing protein [Mycena epipterygia]